MSIVQTLWYNGAEGDQSYEKTLQMFASTGNKTQDFNEYSQTHTLHKQTIVTAKR